MPEPRKDVIPITYNTLGIGRITKIFRGAGGCAAKRVLVRGPQPNEAANPAGANAGNLAGVSFDSAEDGKGVALSEYGYPEVEIASAVAYGAIVNVADAGGRVKTVNEAAGTKVTLAGVAETAGTAAGQKIKLNCKRFGEEITV